MIRLGCGYAMLTKSKGRRGDARGAYLQAPLSGPPVFMSMDAKILPPGWNRGGDLFAPIRRAWNSLYGLQRGSCDRGRRAHGCITGDLKGEFIADHGEGSLYLYSQKK